MEGPAEPRLCPARPQTQPSWSPPPRLSERGAAAGTRDANGDFLIYFSHGNLSLWLRCPFTFSSRRAGDPARREGAGGARAQGKIQRGDGDPSRAGAEREVGVGPAEDGGEAEDARTSGAAGGRLREDRAGFFACLKL